MLTQAGFEKLKSKLSRAIRSNDDAKIIKTCDEALGIFEKEGYPDSWNRWQRAKDDAIVRQRYAQVDFVSRRR